MDVIVASEQANASTISAMVGYLEQRSAVCAKVLNRNGEVVAINRRGLELLKVDVQDICGKMWTAFWNGETQSAAEASVREAFDGRPSRFVGDFHGTGERTVWEVETFPLERDDEGVKTILVISVNITAAAGADEHTQNIEVMRALSDTLHAISNLSSISTSSARLLSRNQDDPMVQDVAKGLDDAARRAGDAVKMLREIAQQIRN
ncbi:PAS domain-containing protein [Sagittula sp. S175]|uniref:PAS domain-containing protein n=1 Tax=Sagittula sp. S175 TaxID=3415129 RepID=UPI003C797F63